MYTIQLDGLTFTGTLTEVAEKYLQLSPMLGGDKGWASYLTVTDRFGDRFDIKTHIDGIREMLFVS